MRRVLPMLATFAAGCAVGWLLLPPVRWGRPPELRPSVLESVTLYEPGEPRRVVPLKVVAVYDTDADHAPDPAGGLGVGWRVQLTGYGRPVTLLAEPTRGPRSPMEPPR